jgi:hypothetical protein
MSLATATEKRNALDFAAGKAGNIERHTDKSLKIKYLPPPHLTKFLRLSGERKLFLLSRQSAKDANRGYLFEYNSFLQ